MRQDISDMVVAGEAHSIVVLGMGIGSEFQEVSNGIEGAEFTSNAEWFVVIDVDVGAPANSLLNKVGAVSHSEVGERGTLGLGRLVSIGDVEAVDKGIVGLHIRWNSCLYTLLVKEVIFGLGVV